MPTLTIWEFVEIRKISQHDRKLITMLADGKGYKEIAEHLKKAVPTIRNEVSLIYEQIGVKDAEPYAKKVLLVRWWLEIGQTLPVDHEDSKNILTL